MRIIATLTVLGLAATAHAADGEWTCTYKEPGVTNTTQITVSNGKVLQVMPLGAKRIPEEVIDLGDTVTWVYRWDSGLVTSQEYELDSQAAQLVETVDIAGMPSRSVYNCQKR